MHQWYWSYELSDFITDSGEAIDFDSYLIPAILIWELIMWVKLSNSGNILKLLGPNFFYKKIRRKYKDIRNVNDILAIK